MGFFEKLKSGLAKTKNALFTPIGDLFRGFTKVDEDLLDELEELLIQADIGVGATEEIMDHLRDAVDETFDTACTVQKTVFTMYMQVGKVLHSITPLP